MTYIADFSIKSPLMEEAAEAVPQMTFEMVDLQVLDGDRPRYIFWANGDEFDNLESALERDQTVNSFICLTSEEDRQLYRVTFTKDAKDKLMYIDACDCDIVFLKSTATKRGSRIRAQVPSQEALRTFSAACQEKEIPFKLEGLFKDGSRNNDVILGMTERQREALVLAYQQGYFGARREKKLEDIAADLGISRQAFADRLRRGLEHLIANTLIR